MRPEHLADFSIRNSKGIDNVISDRNIWIQELQVVDHFQAYQLSQRRLSYTCFCEFGFSTASSISVGDIFDL
jgi:hypothetical protein